MYWISRKLVNDRPDNSYIHLCYILYKRKILLLRIQDVVNLCPKDKIPIYILFVLNNFLRAGINILCAI